jgi:D-glycero-D-manno-heptose 1,7-bisphosphate phosphatase
MKTPHAPPPKAALFLDRDGTLNRDTGFVFRREDWEWLPGAREACRLATEAGVPIVVITNQSGVARGLYGHPEVQVLHQQLAEDLRAAGAHLTVAYYCPHLPAHSVCLCRKPLTLLFERGLARVGAEPTRCLMLGDAMRDLVPAHQLGMRTAWVRVPEGLGTRPELHEPWPPDAGFTPWRTLLTPTDYATVVAEWLAELQNDRP